MTLVLAVSSLPLLRPGQLGAGPLPVPGGLRRCHPVPGHQHYHHYQHHHHSPVVSNHLLAVPPGSLPHLPGLGLPEVLEHDVRVEAVWGGAAGEIARPHHRVKTGGWRPKYLGKLKT